jgi:hypothetical protein
MGDVDAIWGCYGGHLEKRVAILGELGRLTI